MLTVTSKRRLIDIYRFVFISEFRKGNIFQSFYF